MEGKSRVPTFGAEKEELKEEEEEEEGREKQENRKKRHIMKCITT